MPSKKEHESIESGGHGSESTKDDIDEAMTQQTEPSPPADQASAGDDLLSGLCDDVLVHILGLAEHAGDAVRTGALSRRWRGLWRRAPALRFASGRWFEHGGRAHGFIASVDDTLALRARSGHGRLEELEIRFLMWDYAFCEHKQQLVPSSVGAAERWIRHVEFQNSALRPSPIVTIVLALDIDIIKGRIPQLDHVRSLKARIIPSARNLNLHSFGDCVASLLTAFKNLRYLRLDIACFHIKEVQSVPKSNFICDHWESHKISFIHLMKADFRGVTGTDCELWFLQYVL
ncbi:uncharacterized protein LOC105915095 [Setaria italica]|uniref:uncharacterized protein LOC105915095 n=1 Tax=Setaria italica TaxID=4555 RepID=UPI00064746D2|nr:uncharacterized protein LOC105915095 [Setaria italica]